MVKKKNTESQETATAAPLVDEIEGAAATHGSNRPAEKRMDQASRSVRHRVHFMAGRLSH